MRLTGYSLPHFRSRATARRRHSVILFMIVKDLQSGQTVNPS